MKLLMEIRPGEGGDDAKMLVEEQARIYLKFAQRNSFKAEILEHSVG